MTFVRTNVVLDKELVKKAMDTYGFTSVRQTIDFALRRLVAPAVNLDDLVRAVEGSGWEGELNDPPDWT